MIYLLGICWIGVTDRFGWKALPGTTGVSISMKTSTEVWTKLIPLIRMTEMYYIIAETATDETEALDALNTVLFNRGVKELEDKTQLAGMLRDEYRREFFGEGQLFFYYKRLNVKVLHSYSENADLDMDAAKYVVPLPLSETDFR